MSTASRATNTRVALDKLSIRPHATLAGERQSTLGTLRRTGAECRHGSSPLQPPRRGRPKQAAPPPPGRQSEQERASPSDRAIVEKWKASAHADARTRLALIRSGGIGINNSHAAPG